MPAPGDTVLQTAATEPRRRYAARRAAFEAARQAEAGRSTRLSTLRVVAFTTAIALGVAAELGPGELFAAGAAAALAVFIGLVLWQSRVRERERRLATLRDLATEGERRLDRAWESLPPRPAPAAAGPLEAAEDLDLFGQPALAQLLGPVGTPAGHAALARHLLRDAEPAEVAARQDAVRGLAPQVGFRDELAVEARLHPTAEAADIERFLEWARGDAWLARRPILALARWIVPAASSALIVLDATGAIEPALWAVPLALALGLSLRPGAHVRRIFGRAFDREGLLQAYPALFERACAVEPHGPALTTLRERLAAGGLDAPSWMRRLARLEHLSNLRFSALIYGPVQLLTLWDLHVLAALERWQVQAGPHVRDWLHALGEIEALAALAALAHDQPDWCWPVVDESADRIDAQALAHPMLADAVRVANDVMVGPPGTFLLVTGSNMSGKSTLLRAIGANVVLARAGAPACARRLTLPPLRIATSIHVQDSLVRGTSYFMAQLRRMKHVVEAAGAGGPRLLYLLDEMLQGTNTAERRIAATRVIRHLLDAGAIGAVTTHDLELAGEAVIAGAARAVHFTESVTADGARPTLSFDYVLRPGVATSTNALRLMEIVGLA